MILEALQWVVERSSRPTHIELDGRTYAVAEHVRPVKTPTPETVTLHTLQGLCDYVDAQPFELMDEHLTAHIVGPRSVRLFADANGEFCERAVFASCKPPDGDHFPFGHFLDAEDFVIKLLSLFAPTGSFQQILTLASNLTAESVKIAEDDGFSQIATTKRGVKLQAASIENPVQLAPYRTFADIDQPESDYVLRLRGYGERQPELALFEVDDGKWRMACINGIYDFLRAKLPENVTVLR